MVGVELQAEKTVYEYVEKEQNSQDARDREEESREEESEWREEGWREEEWPQKEPPCKKFKGAQARGGPAQDENAPIPRDTPHWIFLDELPEHMEGYVQQGLVLATEGNTRKALYSTADDALGHVLVEDDVLFEDDADWTKFPEIAAALKTLGDREECITLAMSPSRAQWGIGVSMKGTLRHRAAKLALAAHLALEQAEFGEELPDLSDVASFADFVEEARDSRS